MHMEIARLLHAKRVVTQDLVNMLMNCAKECYTENTDIAPKLFPPDTELQTIFGMEKDIYLYIDELHPRPLLRRGLNWDYSNNQSLLSWLQENDKKL